MKMIKIGKCVPFISLYSSFALENARIVWYCFRLIHLPAFVFEYVQTCVC